MTANKTRSLVNKGSVVTVCKTNPCPFCAIGQHHELTLKEAKKWWRNQCDDFVNKQDPRSEGPWFFFIQAMAMKAIMRIISRDPADSACGVLVAWTDKCGDQSMTEVQCNSELPGSVDRPRLVANIVPAAMPGIMHDGDSTVRWQFRSGKQGAGDWRDMDQERSALLEAAFSAGRDMLVIPADEGLFYRYNFRCMQ
jgi:hypothetical protein